MIQPASTDPQTPPRAAAWMLTCAAGILTCLALKSLVNVQVIPFWGGTDPMREVVIDVGLKPSQIMVLDAVVLICAALLIALGRRAASKAWLTTAGLSLLASGWIVHSIARGSHDPTLFEQELMASAWISGLMAMLGLWRAAASSAGIRWLGIAVFAAVCLALMMKGALQIFIEHPQLVQNFKANREAIFAANGWTPDSAAARGYERRILQPEASGFTGFSNVTASFLLAGLAGLSGLFLALVFGMQSIAEGPRSVRPGRWRLWVVLIAALACGLGVVWTGSKAGQLLAVAGTFASLLGVWWLRRQHQSGDRVSAATSTPSAFNKLAASLLAFAPLIMSAAVVLGVLVRGVIGERLSELSVLFRWHYLIGAARAFASDPIAGVGVDGFQSAYARLKVPFSPEDVSSPHFQLAEWIAVLGVGGIAMAGMVLLGLFTAGIRLTQRPSHQSDPQATSPAPLDSSTYLSVPDRWMMRAAVLIAAVITLTSLHVMREALTGGELMLRLGVLLALVLSVKYVLNIIEHAADDLWLDWLDASSRCVLMIFAGLLIAHSQFELTGTNIQTAGLVLAMLGLAAGSSSAQPTSSVPLKPRPLASALRAASAATALILAMGGILIQQSFSGMESQLERSARSWSTVREIQLNLDQAMRQRDPAALELASMAQSATVRALSEHAALEDLRWWMQPRGYWPMARSSSQSMLVVARQFSQMAQQMAAANRPEEARSMQLRSLWLISAAEQAVLMPYDLQGVQQAINRATAATRDAPPPPSLTSDDLFEKGRTQNVTRLAWLGAVYEEWARQLAPLDPPQSAQGLRRAITVATEAAQLEPYSLPPAMKVLRLAIASGDQPLAKQWATEALKRNDLQRLDAEVRGLSPAERAEVDRVLATP